MANKAGKLGMSHNEKVYLPRAYAKWIDSTEWDLCTTLATEKKTGMKGARELGATFYDEVTKYFPNAQFLNVIEPYDLRSSFHTHGLLSLGQPASEKCDKETSLLENLWRVIANGGKGRGKWTLIEPYRKGEGWALYLAHKMSRHGVDWELYKPIQ